MAEGSPSSPASDNMHLTVENIIDDDVEGEEACSSVSDASYSLSAEDWETSSSLNATPHARRSDA
eukprot:5365511-Prymnesium_polylepis.2